MTAHDGATGSRPIERGAAAVDAAGEGAVDWASLPDRLRTRGLRWTSQRKRLVEVLSRTGGHVTGAELVERCRAVDPATTPSTVYRTLDVLEELGVVRHSHGPDGHEEFHVLPVVEHGHLHCRACGGRWEIGAEDAAAITRPLAGRGFRVDVSHLTIVGRCADCAEQGAAASGPALAP